MSKMIKGLLVVGGAVMASAMPVLAGVTIRPVVGVPEPSAILMIASGLGAVAGLRYWKLRKS